MRNICSKWLVSGFLLAAFNVAVDKAAAQKPDAVEEFFQAIETGRVTVVDLTHPLDEQSPFWPEGAPQSPFHATLAATIERDGYFARALALPEHFGTHIDAPAHFDPKGVTIDQIPLQSLMIKAVVVDVTGAPKSDADYRVTVADLENWAKSHGHFPRGCVVFFRTGWATRWPSQELYMNQDTEGVLHFPGLSLQAAQYLVERAHPLAIGIDTASIDYGPSNNFEVHHFTMAAGLYHLENVANLDQLPATGAYIIASPMKLRGGSGSPTRVLAFVGMAGPATRPGRRE